MVLQELQWVHSTILRGASAIKVWVLSDTVHERYYDAARREMQSTVPQKESSLLYTSWYRSMSMLYWIGCLRFHVPLLQRNGYGYELSLDLRWIFLIIVEWFYQIAKKTVIICDHVTSEPLEPSVNVRMWRLSLFYCKLRLGPAIPRFSLLILYFVPYSLCVRWISTYNVNCLDWLIVSMSL